MTTSDGAADRCWPTRVFVTRADLGGWLFRRRSTSPSLPRLVGSGGEDRFCVRRTYRTALMHPGDSVWLWVSGRDRTYERGLWANGVLLEEPSPDGWVPVELRPLTGGPLTDRELRSHGIDDLEVQRQPFGSNPSWISVAQLARLLPLIRPRRSARQRTAAGPLA